MQDDRGRRDVPDQGYRPEQIGSYGAARQPAVAARMTPHLRTTQVGTVAAALSVAASAAALAVFPRFNTSDTGLGWAVLMLVCCVLMLATCVFQVVVWRQAMGWWRGSRATGPGRLAVVSWWLHVVSYVVAVGALWAAMAGSYAAGWSVTAADLLAVALLLVLAAQILAAVQYVRPEGPPGTVPAHMRRLVARERARQAAAAAIVRRDSPREDGSGRTP